ncbi:hypothetical protein MMC24_007904 [Lignoscripta atroalba]|nr:hypothetical protein [Lignoscripta atroalba]
MKIEINILPVNIRLDQKCKLYAIRVITLPENHTVRKKTPRSYPSEYETDRTDEDTNFLQWNEDSESQIIQEIDYLHSSDSESDTGSQISEAGPEDNTMDSQDSETQFYTDNTRQSITEQSVTDQRPKSKRKTKPKIKKRHASQLDKVLSTVKQILPSEQIIEEILQDQAP